MAGETAAQTEPLEQQEIGKEELSSATEVMQLILKTSKAFKMYLPNNPLLIRFLDDLKAGMTRHLGTYGELKLDVDQFTLRYKGKSVYESKDPKDSMAFKIYSDGIRSLIFSEGIEEKEIADFLEVVGKDRPNEMDDDIVTLLWMKDLPHITYILAEDYLEFDTAGAASANQASQQDKIRGIYKVIPPTPPLPSPMMIPQNILTLSEAEIGWLKKAREEDEKKSSLDEVVSILSSILVVEKESAVFGEFIDIMSNLTSNLLQAGELRHSLRLLKFFRDLMKDEKLPPAHMERLKKIREGNFPLEIIRGLEGIIDKTDIITMEELKELLLLFGEPAIKPVCELLASVQKMEVRKAIVDALVEVGKGSPGVFFPFLADGRWYLVRNTVLILRRIANPVSLEPVSRLTFHKEPRVRKEVLLYLEGLADPRAKGHILKFLQDEVGALRVHALKAVAAAKYQAALKPILDMTTSSDFDQKDISERKAVFEAIGELGADEAVPMFRKMILKRYWFNKKKEREEVIFAVSGLRKIRSEAALKVLEEADAVKKNESKALISQTLRSIMAERAKVQNQ